MPEILQDLFVNASPEKVFSAIATVEGLNSWWTKTCEGVVGPDEEFVLGFGHEYQWSARVVRIETGHGFEIEFTAADSDWTGTHVAFDIDRDGDGSRVMFRHSGWRAANEHFRISSHCWALYLRLMRRYVEHGDVIPYEDRLAA